VVPQHHKADGVKEKNKKKTHTTWWWESLSSLPPVKEDFQEVRQLASYCVMQSISAVTYASGISG